MFINMLLIALILWLLVAEPLLGHRSHRRMLAALDAGAANARLRFYRSWIWQGWLLVGVVLAITVGVAGWTPGQLGFRLPRGGCEFPFAIIVGITTGLLIGSLLGVVLMRRRPVTKTPAAKIAGGENVFRLLPRGRSERWVFAALALTAGVGEEIVWRGFGIATLLFFFPHAPIGVVIAVSAMAFGWAHVYQGIGGVFATGLIGAVMTGLFLVTGSLLIPMLLHTLVDLRVLLIPVTPDPFPPGSRVQPYTRC